MNEKLLTEINENLKLLLGSPKKPDKKTSLKEIIKQQVDKIELKYARKFLLNKQ